MKIPANGTANDFASDDPDLPIEGAIDVDMSLTDLWRFFADVSGWPTWNACFWWARGELKAGTTLYWFFNPVRPRYLFRLPVIARLTECIPERVVTWEVTALPGFRARHTYRFESLGPNRCRFSTWEIAEGPLYRILRRYWLAHFRFVCSSSLEGARSLSERTRR